VGFSTAAFNPTIVEITTCVSQRLALFFIHSEVEMRTTVPDLRPLEDRVSKRSLSRIELAHEISNKFPSFTYRDSRLMIDTLFAVMTEALAAGKRIEIRGFGSFSTYRKNGQRYYVPALDRKVPVDAMWKIKFTMTKTLRRSLMEKLEK
jgi:integration host factor subunit beta